MRNNRRWTFILGISIWLLGIPFYSLAQSASYSVKIGDITVTALLDGTIPINADQLFAGSEPGKVARLLEKSFLKNPVELSINAYLIQDGEKRILVDAGSGELMGKYGGKLTESLKQAGVQPEEITDILITHVHADHSGGLVVAGKKIFPHAIIHVHQTEVDFWLNAKNKQAADPKHMGADPQTFTNAENVLTPYLRSNQVKTFNEATAVLPHIMAMPYPGHTPGHTVYVLSSKNEKLYFWGDMIHMAAVQLPAPALPDHFDVDVAAQQKNRHTFYNRAAQEKHLIAAAHISFPGIGHLQKSGDGFLWLPVPFSLEGRTE
ncbi:MBL fold metallo-hydrolase [Chitinophaga varians]|uniref:MBL fold metallo-hydrolase n=1 Tax=Chitinophaga varians TaxID=2202339 RepID=UPI00165EF997|nr:MBL fold metallo-hydrolase [Chitinophaga varians]MBC9909446.1 MBL fold metallo-hydrolase [Chitinophaga varians]